MSSQQKFDPWMIHLRTHKLLDLHQEAQLVGWRVRTANGWSFELEYEAGLEKYTQPGAGLKTFPENEIGMDQARAFLASVRQYVEQRKQQQEEGHTHG